MKTNKKSPFTGGAVELIAEQATTRFRNEQFSYTSYYYRCIDTGRVFSDNELDDRSLQMVYDQYRYCHGIPSKEEIKKIREQYGLSALAMAKVLGLGDNQYRLYEEGSIPSESVGKLIALAKQKTNMMLLLDGSKNVFPKKVFNRMLDRVKRSCAPIVLALSTPVYSEQSYSEHSSGQLISKKITRTNYIKSVKYADASGF